MVSNLDTTAIDTLTTVTVRVSSTPVPGDPVPYTVGHDDTVGILLLTCFLIGIIAATFSRNVMLRHLKHFFYVPKSIATTTTTAEEKHAQYFLMLNTILCIAIISLFHHKENSIADGNNASTLLNIGLYALITACSFVWRYIMYHCVNWTFFDKQRNEQWMQSWFFLSACEGILLLPAIILHTYSNLSLKNLIFYSLFIVIVTKFLAFYKCKTIFFKGIGGFMQIILYLCTLEIVPLIILCGVLIKTSNNLELYF